MSVSVQHAGRVGGAARARATCALLERYATRMLRALGLHDAELSILLCDDRLMRELNRAHRGIDRSTDVLAFAMREGAGVASLVDVLGDVVLARPTVARQAREHGWTIDLEMCLLLAHGLLHLLGFDHATRRDERRMMARTHLLMAAALSPWRGVEKHGRPAGRRRLRNPMATSPHR